MNSSFVTIEDNVIHDTRQWQYNGEGVYIGTGSAGPADNTHHVVIRNNHIYNTTDEAIELKAGTHDCTVERNFIHNVTTSGDWNVTWGAIEINQATGGEQYWGSDPRHIIRNNIIHSSKTGIHTDTGSTIYNNLVYNIAAPYYGIYVDNSTADAYVRRIYHNTIDVQASRAIVSDSAIADIVNNIGPASPHNITTSAAFYVDRFGADYRLAAGSPPIDTGLDLTGTVPTDIDGYSRAGATPDLGAYEYRQASRPMAPHTLILK
jgi:hypothetical protein